MSDRYTVGDEHQTQHELEARSARATICDQGTYIMQRLTALYAIARDKCDDNKQLNYIGVELSGIAGQLDKLISEVKS